MGAWSSNTSTVHLHFLQRKLLLRLLQPLRVLRASLLLHHTISYPSFAAPSSWRPSTSQPLQKKSPPADEDAERNISAASASSLSLTPECIDCYYSNDYCSDDYYNKDYYSNDYYYSRGYYNSEIFSRDCYIRRKIPQQRPQQH